MQETISLRGGHKYMTENRDCWFKVTKGNVLVYLVPFLRREAPENPESGPGGFRMGRRQFIYRAGEGEDIPALCHDSELYGKWRFIFIALDTAELIRFDGEPGDELLAAFAKKAEIILGRTSKSSVLRNIFEEELIERYNKNDIKEKGYVYANVRGEKQVVDRSLRATLRMFQKDEAGGDVSASSGHELYDSAAFICRRRKMHIASLEKIRETCGRRFTLADIGRVSHFVIREVILSDKWYRQDNGILLTFTKEDKKPLSCYQKGVGKYYAYDAEKEESRPVGEELASSLEKKAYLFYRPFPEKPMGRKDIILFGLSEVFPSDVIRLLFLTLLGTIVGLFIPLMNEYVFDSLIPAGDFAGLISAGAVILSLFIGNIAFTVVKNLAGFRAMNSMKYAVQSAAIDRLYNLPSSFLRQFETADLTQRVIGISTLYQVVAENGLNVILTAVFSVMYLIMMFRFSVYLAVCGLLMLIPASVVLFWLGFREAKLEREKLTAELKSNAAIYDYLEGIEKIKITQAENRALSRYLNLFIRTRSTDMKAGMTTVLTGALTDCLPLLFSAVLYAQMIKGASVMSVGTFSGFIAAFSAVCSAMMSLVRNFLMFNMAGALFTNAEPILATLPESNKESVSPEEVTGELEADHVFFSYSPDAEPVLKDISFHLKPGEYAAVVGASGSGKSTLLKLLLGFEKPDLGKIYYGRQDLDTLDKRELRKKLGVVLQNDGLISGSIYENISITAPNVKMERVEETLREVGLSDDIKAMPMGLHTVVSEGGGTISGGQMQRILIARAVVGNPNIIFLDEATSALDNVTQDQVMDTLRGLKATKLVIAHRLTTVRNCDRIFVMDKGRIVEEGSYDTLMERKGLFFELAKRQL